MPAARAAPMFALDLGDGLRLELLHPAHAEALYAAVDANRGHLGPWMPWVETSRAVDDTRAFVARAQREYAEGASVTAVVRSGEAVAGCCSLQAFNAEAKSCQAGYWLAAAHTGRGLATRALVGLMRFGFAACGLRRIDVLCAETNARSAAVAERAGMTRTGTLREEVLLDGVPTDARLYSILAHEFAARDAAAGLRPE